MRIATWNINGLRARLDFLRLWLSERQPDVVALQELKLETADFPHQELADCGYQAAVFGQKAWNGVAVLSRQPVEVVESGFPGQQDLGSRWLLARTSDLLVASVYCPNGKHLGHEDFPRKLQWFDDLAAHLRSLLDPRKPLVVGGDFNVCPDPLDSWNEVLLRGGIFHTAEERQRFRALLDNGLFDTYRETSPEGRDFSWWDYRAGAFHRNQGLRIDLVLASKNLLAEVHGVSIDRDYRKKKEGLVPSDHAPVVVDFSFGSCLA